LQDDGHGLAFQATREFFFDFDSQVLICSFVPIDFAPRKTVGTSQNKGQERLRVLDRGVDLALKARDFHLGEILRIGIEPADSALDQTCFRLKARELSLMPFYVCFEGLGGVEVELL
jgi:hypothetical protein